MIKLRPERRAALRRLRVAASGRFPDSHATLESLARKKSKPAASRHQPTPKKTMDAPGPERSVKKAMTMPMKVKVSATPMDTFPLPLLLEPERGAVDARVSPIASNSRGSARSCRRVAQPMASKAIKTAPHNPPTTEAGLIAKSKVAPETAPLHSPESRCRVVCP